jgi:hypothetical protein
MHTIHLEIAGVGLAIDSENPDFISQIADRYEGFVAPNTNDFRWTLDTERGVSTMGEDLPVVTDNDTGYHFDRRDFHIIVNSQNKTVTGSCAPNMYSFDSCLRVFFTRHLLDLDGLMIHGASVVNEGKAYLFFGVSGAGKTTTARISAPREVLSDELTILRREGNGFRAFGTPFWGELQKNGENINAPLAAINLLIQDTENRLEPMPPRASLKAIMPCVLFFARDNALVNRAVGLAADLVAAVPANAMHFLPDNTFWRLFTND